MERAEDVYGSAADFYRARVNHEPHTITDEIRVVISMLAKEFTPDEVIDVLTKESPLAKKLDAEEFRLSYARILTDRCVEINKVYTKLKASSEAVEIGTPLEAYCYFASAHMKAEHLSVLDQKDDQAIVKKMYDEGLPEPFVMASIRFSPVLMEPGRDRNHYIAAVLAGVQQPQKQQEDAMRQYPITAKMYLEKADHLQKIHAQRAASHINRNRSYYDCVIARELLEEHQLRFNVERAVIENSPMAKELPPNEAEAYARQITDAAQKALFREHILTERPIFDHAASHSYLELKAKGMTAAMLYRNAIRRRVMAYPSTADRLTDFYIDRDAVEYLFTRYPDIERKDLEDALHTESPRAVMPGVPKDYPMRVIDEVRVEQERLATKARKQEAYSEKAKEEVSRARSVLSAGAPADNAVLCTGLAVIRTLQEGKNAADIYRALRREMSPKSAEWIVRKAKDALDRTEWIASYAPCDEETRNAMDSAQRAEDAYLRRARALSENGHGGFDMGIVRDMLLHGYEPKDIRAAVARRSPTAAEPGRNKEEYAAHVLEHAQQAIERAGQHEEQNLTVVRPERPVECAADHAPVRVRTIETESTAN